MAVIKYNVKGVETGGALIPVGVYKCKVVKAVDASPEGKDRRIEAVYEIVEGKFKGRQLYDYIQVEREDLAWKLASFVRAIGLPDEGGLDLKKIIGKMLNVRVAHREYQGEMQPNIRGLLPLGDDDTGVEDEEDLGEGEEGDVYTLEELNDLDNSELKGLAEELGVEAPARLNAAAKKKLAKAVFDAQGSEEEGDDEEEEDDEEGVDLDALSRAELKALIKEEGLDITVLKKHSDDDIRALIADALGEEEEGDDEEEEDDEEEGETVDYSELTPAELTTELKERGLPTKGTSAVKIARLEKDDASKDENPF